MPTREDLKYYQSMPLEMKIAKTKDNIREFVREYGVDECYVSFSGGKDSTVLLDIARQIYPNIEAVFVNTGLEYPEIQKFVKTFDNVRIIYPKHTFKEERDIESSDKLYCALIKLIDDYYKEDSKE